MIFFSFFFHSKRVWAGHAAVGACKQGGPFVSLQESKYLKRVPVSESKFTNVLGFELDRRLARNVFANK